MAHKNARLEIVDPLEYWTKCAYFYASKINLPVDFIDEARDIIVSAFSKDWLEKLFKRKLPCDSLIPNIPHPMKTFFKTPGESQVVSIMELAVYIKKLCHSKNFYDVIQIIKDSFFTGFMQLAYAYRFQRAGAKNIVFEPQTDRGKADIYYEFDTIPYLIECYVPHIKKEEDPAQYLRKAIPLIFGTCTEVRRKLRVYITLKKHLPLYEGQELGRYISDVIKKMGTERNTTGTTPFSEYEITDIENLSEDKDFPLEGEPYKLYGDADWGIRQKTVSEIDIEKVRRGESHSYKEGSRIFVKTPRKKQNEDEYVDRLIEKLDQKIKQTKRQEDSPRRIIIATYSKAFQLLAYFSCKAYAFHLTNPSAARGHYPSIHPISNRIDL